MHDLHPFPKGESWATSINSSGQVAGHLHDGTSDPEAVRGAFVYSSGVMEYPVPNGTPNDINDKGWIVGTWWTQHTMFLHADGVTHDIGNLGGEWGEEWWDRANGVNERGQIVGASVTPDNRMHAFLYTDGQMFDLNSLIDPASGWELLEATAINDGGQIVGWGDLTLPAEGSNPARTVRRAFLTTPEPSTPALLSMGILALLVCTWRRKK